ncbi:MAG: diguanylate cyclase [Rhodanobacter sp.]|nr:MAG: diguanylate cyclase [Rhodanobacter sp.]TAL96624.1 MAG: diguanylate cyclase [Rhodanobacter sp.]TAM40517.1 MAG: diguanylate cyclase [Rhodanobacter sp.]TAN28592.1 MAG: diguanylate cyclase [Rhodanobacter sp.]
MTERSDSAEVVARRATALLDKEAIRLRHELVELQQQLSSARQDLSAQRATQLREANQKLVLAALQADQVAEQALTDLATLRGTYQRDGLTGAINRAPMLDRVQQALLMARRDQRRMALVFVDLDDFKQINDRLGHAAGDEVLQIAARSLQSVLRESDAVSRYGGDEFLVLLAEISAPADAGRVAASMLAALSVPVSVGGQLLELSASLGIGIYPDDGEDMATLIDRADSAMYRHKRHGLGNFRLQGEAWYQERNPTEGVRQRHAPERTSEPLQESPLQNLREANAQLVLAALQAQQSTLDATAAQRRQVNFMAMVAHELRNPLTPLRIATDLLINRSTDDIPVARLQAIIDGEVTHLTRLIDDLVDGSRLSTGKLRIDRSDFDLQDILNQVVDFCRPGMELRHQHLSMHALPEPAGIHGDPVRMTQIFRNLLDNASKYTPENGEIAIELLVLDGSAVISVRDNGIGISAEALPAVFDLFVQDESALPHSNGGLGIGLAVVRDLVQAHGGQVVAHSAGRGRGSEFVVTLPLAKPDVTH